MTLSQRNRPQTRPFRTNITMRYRTFGSVLDIGAFYAGPHSSIQVPPAPARGQPVAHHEALPPPVGGVVGSPGIVQNPCHNDMAYQGILDYRPRPIAVSIFHLTATGPPYH